MRQWKRYKTTNLPSLSSMSMSSSLLMGYQTYGPPPLVSPMESQIDPKCTSTHHFSDFYCNLHLWSSFLSSIVTNTTDTFKLNSRNLTEICQPYYTKSQRMTQVPFDYRLPWLLLSFYFPKLSLHIRLFEGSNDKRSSLRSLKYIRGYRFHTDHQSVGYLYRIKNICKKSRY